MQIGPVPSPTKIASTITDMVGPHSTRREMDSELSTGAQNLELYKKIPQGSNPISFRENKDFSSDFCFRVSVWILVPASFFCLSVLQMLVVSAVLRFGSLYETL